MAPMFSVHPDALVLADLMLAEWPAVRDRIRASGHPTCEDDDSSDDSSDDATGKTDDGKTDDAGTDNAADDKGDDKGDDQVKSTDDWQAKARKHERALKNERKAREAAEAKLREREAADLSEQEKAIAKAREDATNEVTSKFEAERRTDRIESAVTKMALGGFKAKDGDGNDVTLKFADPDDAQLRVDRALRNDELSYDDIYADGKVQSAALTEFLTELLEEHPRLRATDGNGGSAKKVDFDAGKGKGSGGKSLEDMSPDDHLKAIQGRR